MKTCTAVVQRNEGSSYNVQLWNNAVKVLATMYSCGTTL